ncbi:YwmB family TATA-box binding protein [Paenibacillus eucommiae]|uniref:Uncharacterized protein n=1 Tax=Paenibacillus eucommiae TaxID=1355755 RepID=A0ABS4IUK6_9BACL|nr:YwmB family TATA-box binding protein [Paenibacillus eucommiae]MBP1990254.1 hypothetical protein [Paenibacillus eucommiae]
MKKAWLVSITCMVIISIVLGWTRLAGSVGARVSSSVGEDAGRLLAATGALLQQDRMLTLTYTGILPDGSAACNNQDRLLLAGQGLSGLLEFPQAAELEASNGHPVYVSEKAVGTAGLASVRVAGQQGTAACYMVLRLTTPAAEGTEAAMEWQAKVQHILEQAKPKQAKQGQWVVMVQGIVSEQSAMGKTGEGVLKDLIDSVNGQVKETYTDEGTTSWSASATDFSGFVQSGNHKINLQAAIHESSLNGAWRLTVGTPLITMEY